MKLSYIIIIAVSLRICNDYFIRPFAIVAAQYEDSHGQAHPITYRIDTVTGNTSLILYSVGSMNNKEVRGFVFEDVYKDQPSFFLELDRLGKILEKR